MYIRLAQVILCLVAGVMTQLSVAMSDDSALLKWNRTFIVKFKNVSSKKYTLLTENQGGVCATGKIHKEQEVSCDNIPPLKFVYVMYQKIYQDQAVGSIIFEPVVKPSGLYFWPHKTGIVTNCTVQAPNQVTCQLSDPSLT